MKTKHPPFMFQSSDPSWPKWAVSNREPSTQWFHRKEYAEHYLKTGVKRGLVKVGKLPA